MPCRTPALINPLLFSLLMVALASCQTTGQKQTTQPQHILMVGNSLFYYNDAPAILAGILQHEQPDTEIQVDLLAAAGQSLAGHLAQGQYQQLLQENHYDLVILQDIGGFPSCATGFLSCDTFEQDLANSIRLARDANSEVLWFSTWQVNPAAQSNLSKAAIAVAERLDVDMLDFGKVLHAAIDNDIDPLLPDYHPNLDGSWLIALSLQRHILQQDITTPQQAIQTCRQIWQSQGLKSDRVASEQVTTEPTCDRLSFQQLDRFVEIVNQSVD